MSISFVRQLGAEAGIQLNPLVDNSEIPTNDASDQVFGIIMRATRGRIDKPFLVDRSNVSRLLGSGEQIRQNQLNEAWVYVVEALNNGAAGVVVQRLMGTGETAEVPAPKWISFNKPTTGASAWVAQDYQQPTAQQHFKMAVIHYECFNDGIKLAYHAESTGDDKLTLRLYDSKDVLLFEFTGSIFSDSVDDFGNSTYLPDVIARQTDLVGMWISSDVAINDVGGLGLNAAGVGYDTNGVAKWDNSGIMYNFGEETGYNLSDYNRCRMALQNTIMDYAYIASGGTQSAALVGELMALAYETNRQLRLDIPGHLSPEDAVDFLDQFNVGASPTAHLIHAFWAPIVSDDPTGINPRGYFGASTLNIAYACRRNAQTNAVGFAPKNYPIAGRNWPINRRNIDQTYAPNQYELNILAQAKINPVLFESFTGGGRFVFRDSLTCAQVDSSLKKLVSVADMSTSIDLAVTRAGKDVLQLPMAVAVKRMQDFLTALFEGGQASGWLVPSNAPEMAGAAWKFEVKPNAVRPYDRMDVSYWLRYDGTARQIFVTQTLTR